MTYRLSAVLAVWAVAVAALLVSGSSWGDEPKGKDKPPEPIKWDLRRLNEPPFKLIKSTPDFEHRQVMFLVEFTRPPTAAEEFDWRQSGPVVFRFRDADGVILGTVKPQWLGEFVPKAGTRLRLVLPLPSDQVIDATHSIVAD
jgi:hypothetical protein